MKPFFIQHFNQVETVYGSNEIITFYTVSDRLADDHFFLVTCDESPVVGWSCPLGSGARSFSQAPLLAESPFAFFSPFSAFARRACEPFSTRTPFDYAGARSLSVVLATMKVCATPPPHLYDVRETSRSCVSRAGVALL